MYLFHELPVEVQRAAAAEMARVVKPGGIVVLTDSVQRGDRDAYDATLGNFGDFQASAVVSRFTGRGAAQFPKGLPPPPPPLWRCLCHGAPAAQLRLSLQEPCYRG